MKELIQTQPTNLHQIFCELMLDFNIIFISIRHTDNNNHKDRKHEWVQPYMSRDLTDVLYGSVMLLKITLELGIYSHTV